MAETAKILSEQKKVLIPQPQADCPMANMATKEDVLMLRQRYPDAMVVSYVNSTAEVKSVSDVCCTSGNALKVIANIPAKQILFFPDQNLAAYCQRFTEKQIIPWSGYCYVHHHITANQIQEARALYPDALILVHPECQPQAIDLADDAASTSGMLKIVKESPKKKFLIGTEVGMIERLRRENPNKEIYSAGPAKTCVNMKKTTLEDIYYALEKEQYPVELDPQLIKDAKKPLDKMLQFV